MTIQARKAVLFSEKAAFEARWRPLLERQGCSVERVSPAALASRVSPGTAALFDASGPSYDEDELLSAIGFARAKGALVAVGLEPAEAANGQPSSTPLSDDLFDELTLG